jgi:hypothetical protein
MNYCLKSFKKLEGSYSSLSDTEKQEAIQRLTVASAANIQHLSEFLEWLGGSPPLRKNQEIIVSAFAESLQKMNLPQTQVALVANLKSRPTFQSLVDIANLYSKILPDPTLIERYKSELQ